eukprot:COSAG06_NODE_26205_length_619_cov_2.026923_2_plen_38_part_01
MGLLLCLVNVPPMQVCLRPLQRMYAETDTDDTQRISAA